MKMKKLFGVVLCVSFVISGAQSVNASSENIAAKDYGNQWPFTVTGGKLVCTQPGAVTLVANGKSYAVNGLAKSDNRNVDIAEIWKADSESDHAKYMLKKGRPDLVPKISIAPVIERGLQLCR